MSSFSCDCDSLSYAWPVGFFCVSLCAFLFFCLWFVWWGEHILYLHMYCIYKKHYLNMNILRIYIKYVEYIKHITTNMEIQWWGIHPIAVKRSLVVCLCPQPTWSLKAKCLFQHVAFTPSGTHTYAYPLF